MDDPRDVRRRLIASASNRTSCRVKVPRNNVWNRDEKQTSEANLASYALLLMVDE